MMLEAETLARPRGVAAPPLREPTGCPDCATRSACMLGRVGGQELRLLQASVRELKFQKGDVLASEGQVADMVYVLKVGSVFGYRCGLDGWLRPIGIAGRGAAFGLFGFFGHPNQVTGIAASSGRACGIPVAVLQAQARHSTALADDVHAAMVRTCGWIAAWSEGMRVQGVVNQLAYAVLLLSEAQRSVTIELPNHTALAGLLGSTRETVARAMATLEKSGAIRRHERKMCEVLRGPLLERLGAASADTWTRIDVPGLASRRANRA